MSRPYYNAENFVSRNSLGYLVKRCAGMLMILAESKFDSEPLSFTHWVVLMNLLGHESHMSATALSKETGHDMGALTRVVDSLEQSGLVRRERSQHDRRTVEITLTAAGRRQVESTRCVVMDMTNEMLSVFSHDEVHTLITLLQRLFTRLQHYSDMPPEQLRAEQERIASKAATRRSAPSRGKSKP